jgi:hypothetical protein
MAALLIPVCIRRHFLSISQVRISCAVELSAFSRQAGTLRYTCDVRICHEQKEEDRL